MTAADQQAQNGPATIPARKPGRKTNRKGSSIMARLRAGDDVPGYRLVKGRLERDDGKKELPPRVEKEFDRLKVMKYVLANGKSNDVTAGEKACRSWLERSPGQFMETLDRLEAEAKKAASGSEKAEDEKEVEETESDEELNEAIGELLARHTKRAKT